MDFIQVLAIITVCFSGIGLAITPAVMGRPKPNYGYMDFVRGSIEFVTLLFLALRILNKI